MYEMCANLDAFDEGIAHAINFNQIATGYGDFGSLLFFKYTFRA